MHYRTYRTFRDIDNQSNWLYKVHMRVNWRKVGLFLLLTFAVNWGMAYTFFALGGTLQSVRGFLLAMVYMLVPLSMALLVQKGIYRQPGIPALGIRNPFPSWKWLLAAWLLPVILAFAALGATLLWPGMHFDPKLTGVLNMLRERGAPQQQLQAIQDQIDAFPTAVWLLIITVQALIAGPTINTIFAFGEEAGWRGLLLKELAPLGFWPACLFIGVVWGVWHAPLILHGHNYPQHPQLGVLLMTVFTLLFTPLITYIRLRNRSVFAAAVMHGSLNAIAGISILFVSGGTDYLKGIMGIPGFLVLLAANLALIIYDRFYAKTPVMATLTERG